eukprot:4937838-Karenia_brevis.AAC.1
MAPYFKFTMIKLDWMHAVDLGVLAYEIGEIWWALLPKLSRHGGGRESERRSQGLLNLKMRLKHLYQ